MTTLSDIGEFGLIARFQAIVDATPVTPEGPPATSARVGIGDDAAVWRPAPGKELVLTCDAFVEGRHFLPLTGSEPTSLEAIGARVATANLSDIAAMAALPCFALVSLGIPKTTAIAHLEAIYNGLCTTLHSAGAAIIGGNVTATEGPMFIDITVAGEVDTGRATLRSGAQPGDSIGVTGFPGSAAAGLALILSQQDSSLPTQETTWTHLQNAYLTPTARLREARLLAPHIHAMTDISDGLFQDLQQLLSHTPHGACLTQSKLPLSNALSDFARHTKHPPQHYLWQPSDDYELLFTAPTDAIKTIDACFADIDTPLHWIGHVTTEAGLSLARKDGSHILLEGQGWDHFGS